jgi:hypothetical protein
MSSQAYVGTAKRTFAQAVRHLLENDYHVLGSGRVLDLLAADLERLVDQFHPAPERLSSGWMVFTGTKAAGNKAHPGQGAGDHELVTLAWPVLTAEDVQELASFPDGSTVAAARRAWWQKRLVRIIEYGWQHPQGPVVLTLADLSTMLGPSPVEISQLLAEVRQTTGKALMTKGYYFDQGLRPTHKEQVIELYEAGMDEDVISHRTGHAPASVGHYIRDYERVKLLLKRSTPITDIGRLLDMSPGLVQAYLDLLHRYHPDLQAKQRAGSAAA